MSAFKITSRLRDKEPDYQAAIEFACHMAYQWYQCHPSEVPQYIFIKKLQNRVVSTVGVTQYDVLPLRNFYQIDNDSLPKNWEWNNVTQLSWFFSNKKSVFLPLLQTALQFSYGSGKRYCILQMKEKLFHILSKKGLKLRQIKNVKLLSDRIHTTDKGYYLDTNPIHLYYLDIAENIRSINYYLNKQDTYLCYGQTKCLYTNNVRL